MASNNATRYSKHAAPTYTRAHASKLKSTTGHAPRSDADIRLLTRRNLGGVATGVIGAIVMFAAIWVLKNVIDEQAAMLMLLLSFAFLGLALISLIALLGSLVEAHASMKLKAIMAVEDADSEACKTHVALEVFSLVATTVQWKTWDQEAQRRLVEEGFGLCQDVVTHKREDDVVERLRLLQAELKSHAPNPKSYKEAERKLQVVEQHVLAH